MLFYSGGWGEQVKTVILCGGKGTRLREQTEKVPKPLVEIGGIPILVHIMKIYSHYGFNDFVLCLGYKGDEIKKYFRDYIFSKGDMKMDLEKDEIKSLVSEKENWKITFVDTGLETQTGGRIKKIKEHIDGDDFFCTYGDGLSQVDLKELLEFHQKNGKIATMTCVQPASPFGMIKFGEDNVITESKEKPPLNQWINGGFFVFSNKIFDHIGDNEILEKEVFDKLVEEKEICAFPFDGFWDCMDTFKDNQVLNEMWKKSEAPWKVWEDG